MRNLFDGDCSPAEEQAAGRWLAEHAETKEADELLYALLRETKPATADAEGASACPPPAGNRAEELGMAARRPLDDAGRRLSVAARRGAGVLSLRRGAAAGRVVRSLCTLTARRAARGAARRLGGGHQFGIETDLSRPLRARSPAGLLAGEGYATIAKDPGRPPS